MTGVTTVVHKANGMLTVAVEALVSREDARYCWLPSKPALVDVWLL